MYSSATPAGSCPSLQHLFRSPVVRRLVASLGAQSQVDEKLGFLIDRRHAFDRLQGGGRVGPGQLPADFRVEPTPAAIRASGSRRAASDGFSAAM